MPRTLYSVVVGNIGSVYNGTDEKEARRFFRDYRNMSQYPHGRAAGESVTLMADGEIVEEIQGENPSE